MATGIGEVLARPDLLRNLVWAELTARYKTTALRHLMVHRQSDGDDGHPGDDLWPGRSSHDRELSRLCAVSAAAVDFLFDEL